MMREVVEKIKNGHEVTIEEAFELVNQYEVTTLDATLAGGITINMNVNQFEKFPDTFEFSPECTTQGFTVKQSDIVSVDTKYEEELDNIFIFCKMKDGAELVLTIYLLKDSKKTWKHKAVRESDVHEVKAVLENVMKTDGWYGCAGISDFSLEMNFKLVSAYIDEDLDLHINGNSQDINVTLYDDSCNLFFSKVFSDRVEIYIRPYGQPFGEIRLIFSKLEQESEVTDNK